MDKQIDIISRDKDERINALVDALPILRAGLSLSQEELSSLIGVSRQTYSALENKKKKMSWNTFLSLVLVFEFNEKTSKMLKLCEAFPIELQEEINNR